VSIVQIPSRGASTDVNGHYRIVGLGVGTYSLRVTYVGYAAQVRTITLAGAPATVDFALVESEITLADYEVTGYGVQAIRSTETAASAVVNGSDIRSIPVQSVDAALQGRAAGVQITSASGAPGAGLTVRVRGVGSINAGSQPLYIVDGVQVRSGTTAGNATNALAGLNPADIENIEVLKDAAAVAIYGAQGANGVVLITTRRGREGPTTFEVSTSYGAADQAKRFGLLNSQELFAARVEAARNRARVAGTSFTFNDEKALLYNSILYQLDANGNVVYQNGAPVFYDTLGIGTSRTNLDAAINALPTVDWQDALFRTGMRRRVDISAQGGARNVTFRVAGGYTNEEGQVVNSAFERYNLSSTLEFAPVSRLKVETSVRFARSQGQRTTADGNFVNSPFFQPARMLPWEAIYLDETNGVYNQNTKSGYNPLQIQTVEQRPYEQNQMTASLRGIFQVRPDLVFTAFGGTDYLGLSQHTIRPASINAYAPGSVFEGRDNILNLNGYATLSYIKTFNRLHNLNVLGGVEARRESAESVSMSGTGLPTGFVTLLPTASPGAPSSSDTQYRSLGAFSQVRYDYDQRYFFSGSLRRDGSSRFGPDNRYGTFFSVSAAWDMARESFLRGSFVDQLQPRVSYGTTGNSNIGNFDYLTLFSRGGSYSNLTGVRLTQLGDPSLGWEESTQRNLGLDFSLFGGRVSGSLDGYIKTNENLLLNRPLVADASVGGGITKNLGAVENRGFEVLINTVNLDRGGFSWTSSFNIGVNRDKITRLLDDTTQRIGTGLTVGESQGYYYLYRWAGVNPADGRSMWYDNNGNITYSPRAIIDQRPVGTIYPLSSGGFINTFTYRGLSLSTFFQFVYKQSTFTQQVGFFLLDPTRNDNLSDDILERWTTPGNLTSVPKLYAAAAAEPGSQSNILSSDRFLEDASYVRLKTLTLGYDLPSAWARRLRMKRVNVYVQGQNLITWTHYKGLDPELISTAAAAYPQPRLWLTGLNVTF